MISSNRVSAKHHVYEKYQCRQVILSTEVINKRRCLAILDLFRETKEATLFVFLFIRSQIQLSFIDVFEII